MRRLGRRWRVVKWMGLILSSLLFVVWAASLGLGFHLVSVYQQTAFVPGEKGYTTALAPGSPMPTRYEFYDSSYGLRSGCAFYSYHPGGRSQLQPVSLRWSVAGHPYSLLCRPLIKWCRGVPGGPGTDCEIFMPLWIPFVLIAIPTALLFWRDRRRIPPHCC